MASMRTIALTTSLGLSGAVKMHQAPSNASVSEGDCACMKWSEVYRMGQTVCGSGRELSFVHDYPGEQVAKVQPFSEEFCANFWAQLPDDNLCFKSEFGSANADDTWCYVSGDCKPMRNGTKLNTKTCVRGEDRILGDMKFEDFARYMDDNKLEKGLALQYAYSVFTAKLPDVIEFWGLSVPGMRVKPLTDELRQAVQQHVDSGKTMFITSVSGHPPFAVSEGKKLYWINFSKAYKKHVAAQEDVWAHKEEMNAWACVAGCDQNEPVF